MHRRFCLLASVAFVSCVYAPARGQEPATAEIPEPYRTLFVEAPKHIADFTEIPVVTKLGEHKFVSIPLDSEKSMTIGEDHFVCVRFTTPEAKSLDLVWAFSVPATWTHWYIVPAKGTMKGFRNWLNADRLYDELPATVDHPAILQTLTAASLEPATSYIIWFRQTAPATEPAKLTATIGLFPARESGEWDAEAIEGALGLKSAPAAQQAEYLKSRGMKALLDARFFEADYASGRIEDALWSMRHSRSLAGGFFIETKMLIPPCKTEPPLAKVTEAHGEPDLVLSAKERVLFHTEDKATSAIHYYDYIGFVVGQTKKGPAIVNVETQGKSAAGFRPQQDGLTWSESPMPELDLRIFYQDRKEVARVAFWGSSRAQVISGKLPEETFVRDFPNHSREELKHLGGGKFEYRALFADGTVARTAALEKFLFDGVRRDFYPDGKPQAEIPYRKGQVDGTVKEWSPDGEVRQQRYRKGERVKGEGA